MLTEYFETPEKFTDTINDRDFNTKFGSSFLKPSKPSPKPYIEETKQPSSFKKEFKSSEKKRAFNPTQCLKNKSSHRTYIELEKEHCELPYINLVQSDEDFITDCGVKVRYGDARSLAEISREMESHLMNDFPLETFLQRTEILNGTLDVMVATADQNVFFNCVSILNKFLDNAVGLYKFLLNPYNRYSEILQPNQKDYEEYIETMYPSNDSSRWREIKFNPDSLNSTNFDSHSLPYALCDIAIKSLDCCLHEDKVGGALTVNSHYKV
jgi:hypothetical protein